MATAHAPIINNTVTQNDLMYFKEEILGNIKRMENKVNEKVEIMTKMVDSKLSPYNSKFDEMKAKIFDLSNLISNDKSSVEKIAKLLEFKAKADDTLQSHEISINQCNRDIANATYKYDRVLLENFMIPGLLGANCKYPTMKSFIESCINQLSQLNTFKDRNTLDLKSYKDKLEGLVKQFGQQIEGIKAVFLDYCKKSVDDCENKFNERIKTTESRIESMRVENGKYAIELKTQCNDLGIQWEKIQKLKEEVYVRFDEEVDKFKKMHSGTESSMDEYKKEFKLIKKKFTELSEFIKDVRFRKNIGGNVKMRELKEMSDKINFDKKQKYELSEEEEDDTKSNAVSDNNIVLKHTAHFASPKTEVKKPSIFTEAVEVKGPFSPQVRRKHKIKESSITEPSNRITDKPIENLDQIESTLKEYIHSESNNSFKSNNNNIKIVSNDEDNSSVNNIITAKKSQSKINLYKVPLTEEENEIKQNLYGITKSSVEIINNEKKDNISIDEVITPPIEKESLTIETHNNNKISDMKLTKGNKKIILSPLSDYRYNNDKINCGHTVTNFKKISTSMNTNTSMFNADIIAKISKAEMKISSLERSTNKKMNDILNQVNHLSLQLKIQMNNNKPNREVKINYINEQCEPLSTRNNFLLNTNETSLLSNYNFIHHQRNSSLYNKSKSKKKMKLDNEFNQTMLSNHFSPLSKLISNEPKYKPSDDSNLLLSNIEPFLIKQFD